MSRNFKTLGNSSMLVISISLIQWHSIQFWIEITGGVGILWSIAIEATGIWLWWQRHTLLACIASLILITGPMIWFALPFQQSITHSQANTLQHSKQLASVEKAINQLKKSLSSYQLTSQSRTGWASRIDKTQNELNIANQRFDQLIINSPIPVSISKHIAIFTIETLTLVLLLITQVLAIGKLRNISNLAKNIETLPASTTRLTPVRQDNKSSNMPNKYQQTESPNQNLETLALDVSKRLSEVLLEESISQAEWARRNEVSPKNVSLLRNYSKRKEKGLESVPKKEIIRMNRILS